MNPKLTLTVEGNKIISAGTVSVGEKIDVKIIGLDSISIPDYDIGAQFSGSSLRFRIVDNSGHDLVRFPMNESDSWIVDEEQGVYNATDVDLNTDKLRNLFEGVAYGDKLQFGIILDSVVDSAQYARGKTYIQQWPMASIDDPKVLPDWGDVLLDLKADLGEVETFKITAEDAARETIGYRNDVFAAKSNVESKAAQVSDLEKKCELHEFKSMQYSQEADGAAKRAIASENNAKGFSDTASSMAKSAANSSEEAKVTLANVVKKSGDTMTGRLTVPSITIGEDEPEDLFVLLGGEFDRVVNESALEVEAEASRAKDAEKVISDNLSEEIGNRKDADLALARKIDENTNSMSLKADLVDGKVPVGQLPNALVSPVYSVNGQTGAVQLNAGDVGAYSKSETDATVARIDAKKLDKTAVVAPSASATNGQAADAKAVNDALAGKVDNVNGVIENQLSVGKAADETVIAGGSIRHQMIGDGGAFVWFLTLPKKSGTFALTSDIEDVISGKANKSELPYSLVVKEIKNGTVSLDDRADNYVDARTLRSSDSLDIDFPTIVDGKSRDFVLAVECGENPPTISYAAFVTIMAEDASTLAPEQGMNIYSFTEFKPNRFLAARKTVDTVVVNTPESADQMLIAMQKRGIDTTNITDFGVVADTLGLDDTATPQDAIDAVMN